MYVVKGGKLDMVKVRVCGIRMQLVDQVQVTVPSDNSLLLGVFVGLFVVCGFYGTEWTDNKSAGTHMLV